MLRSNSGGPTDMEKDNTMGRQSPTSVFQSLDTVDSYLSKHPAPQYKPKAGTELLEYNLKEAMINYREDRNKQNEDKVATAFDALRKENKNWARKKVKGTKTIRQVRNLGNWVNLSNTPGGWRITQGNTLNKENNPAFFGGRRKRTRKRRRKKRTKKKTRRKRHKGGVENPLTIYKKRVDKQEEKLRRGLYGQMKTARLQHDEERIEKIKAQLKKSFDRQIKWKTPGAEKNLDAVAGMHVRKAMPEIEKSMKMGLLVPRKTRVKSAGRRTRKRKRRKRRKSRRKRKTHRRRKR